MLRTADYAVVKALAPDHEACARLVGVGVSADLGRRVPGPTPIAGVPELYAAFTMLTPPVARMRETSLWRMNISVFFRLLRRRIHCTKSTGTPRFGIVWCVVKEYGQWKLDEQISAQRETELQPDCSPTPTATPTVLPSASPTPSGAGVPPIREENEPPSHLVKGNQSGVYHDVDSPYYDATHPEEGFTSAADAQGTGYRAPKR